MYDNMGEVCTKNAIKYIAVTKLVVEFNMCRKIGLGKRSEKGTIIKHINVLCKAEEADAISSIGCVAQT